MEEIKNKNLTQSLKENLFAVLLYIFCVIIFMRPVVLNLNTHILGDGGDNVEHYSYFYLIRDNLLSGKLPFSYSNKYRYPYGFDLASSDARLFVTIGGLFSYFFNPTIIFNLMVLFTLLANAYISFLFFKEITKNYRASIIGGFIHGFSSWVILNTQGGINVVGVFGFPLLALFLYRYYVLLKNRWGDLIGIYLGIIVLALLSVQQLFLVFLYFIPLLILLFIFARQFFNRILVLTTKQFYRHLIVAGITVFILFCIFNKQVEILIQQKNDNQSISTGNIFPLSFFIFPSTFYNKDNYPFLLPWSLTHSIFRFFHLPVVYGNGLAPLVYIGCLVIFLFILSVIAINKFKIFFIFPIMTMISIFFVVLPMIVELEKLTFFSKNLLFPLQYVITHNERSMMIFWFFCAGTISLGLKKLIRNNNLIFITVLLVVLIERYQPNPIWLTEVKLLTGSSYSEFISSLPGEAVLDVPVDVYSRYNILPFSYKKNIVGGMFHWYGDNLEEKKLLDNSMIQNFFCQKNTNPEKIEVTKNYLWQKELLSLLYKMNIKIIVAHKNFWCPNIKDLLEEIVANNEKTTHQYSQEENTLYLLEKKYENSDVVVYNIEKL